MSILSIEQTELKELAARFEHASPQDVLRWAAERYGHNLVVVTSFQPTGIVTLHMLQEIMPGINVLTLDTGLLFPETYSLIDTLESRFNINLHRVRPALTVEEQAREHGDELWKSNPDYCCKMRKVHPLDNALKDYRAWLTGLRRDQSPRRANTPIVSWDDRHSMVKICPFATWTEEMMWTYIHSYELPYNTLHDRGYPSIGCHTCTHAVEGNGDARSGRWAGRGKTECGIHVSLDGTNDRLERTAI